MVIRILLRKIFFKGETVVRWTLCLFLAFSCLFAEETKEGDIQTQIKKIEEQIAIHQRRVRYAEREAQRLLPIDFTDSRRYLRMKESNEREIEKLKKELERLQSQQ
jgi:hypothetical protein